MGREHNTMSAELGDGFCISSSTYSHSHVAVAPMLFLGCFETHQWGFGGGFARESGETNCLSRGRSMRSRMVECG